jgi:hypothetical protein
LPEDHLRANCVHIGLFFINTLRKFSHVVTIVIKLSKFNIDESYKKNKKEKSF